MRRFAPAPVLLLALVAAGCGSGDHTLNAKDARQVVQHTQLTVADLGSGWKQTSDEKPSKDSSDKDLERCVGKDLSIADDTLAESNTRTFERSTSEVDQQQLVVSSAVLANQDRADRLFRSIATKKFAACITQAFEDELKSSEEGVTFEPGVTAVAQGQVPDADHSAHITSPFKLAVDPLKLDGQVDLVMVSSGQTFSLLFGFSLGGPIGRAKLEHLGDVLVARQKA